MADYYKTGGIITPVKKPTEEERNHKSNVLAYTSLILGILSVIVLILLNITNITMTIKKDSINGALNSKPIMTETQGNKISDLIESDLIPKTNLINNMVSYQIPTSLTQIYSLIKRDVLQACTPKFDHEGSQCPVNSNPFHSGSFSLINRNTFSRCPDPNNNLGMRESIKLMDYPSFIPGPTRPGGCSRDPSFDLGNKIFAYTHNVVPQGCGYTEMTMQYFNIGRVTDVNADMPFFEILTQWYLDDGLNRKSCTVVTSDEGAWILCIVTSESEEKDYADQGIGRVFIGYMDIYGRKKSWYLDEPEIQFDLPMAAMYFSGGSGVSDEGKIYVLIYGGLMTAVSGDVFCDAPGCDNPSQDMCKKASMPKSRSQRQMVNGLFIFDDNPLEAPKPIVKLIPPSQNWVGSRGRLYKSDYPKIFFLYISSDSWHSLPKIGIIAVGDQTYLHWVENVAVSRPGPENCMYGNRCPQECLGAPYTDIFPLDSNFEIGISVTLKSYQVNKNPVITLVTQNKIISETEVTNDHHGAQYTTTSCFKYARSLWCLSIVAFEPATVGERAPVPLLYKVPVYCKASGTRLTIPIPYFSNGSRPIVVLTNELYPPEVPKFQTQDDFNKLQLSPYHFERPGTTGPPSTTSKLQTTRSLHVDTSTQVIKQVTPTTLSEPTTREQTPTTANTLSTKEMLTTVKTIDENTTRITAQHHDTTQRSTITTLNKTAQTTEGTGQHQITTHNITRRDTTPNTDGHSISTARQPNIQSHTAKDENTPDIYNNVRRIGIQRETKTSRSRDRRPKKQKLDDYASKDQHNTFEDQGLWDKISSYLLPIQSDYYGIEDPELDSIDLFDYRHVTSSSHNRVMIYQ
ncbi:G protein [Mount Mabu Lophuromys virus 1]|uniref:G protein n=1 Tax=Mount Mabu Lophuromys virus 1 TaxID=2116559 RepID=A0A2P1GJ79_9MONO|nr:G protein [Mount Mabu Lophuromys virus 1]AVM86018.1 G protein [Mount Mabu Lophuromys virus 1]